MKGQKDKKPGVKLLMVINVSLAFFVGRHPLGALLDFHLTEIFKIAFTKIWFSFFWVWKWVRGAWNKTRDYWPLTIFRLVGTMFLKFVGLIYPLKAKLFSCSKTMLTVCRVSPLFSQTLSLSECQYHSGLTWGGCCNKWVILLIQKMSSVCPCDFSPTVYSCVV